MKDQRLARQARFTAAGLMVLGLGIVLYLGADRAQLSDRVVELERQVEELRTERPTLVPVRNDPPRFEESSRPILAVSPTSNGSFNEIVLYDPTSKRLAVYANTGRGLELEAIRTTEWDLMFTEYPSRRAPKPTVSEVREAVSGS